MNYTVTVSSKNQVTIPAELSRKWGIVKGHKLSLVVEGKKAILQPAANVVDELYGSVKVPARFRGMEIDEMIEKAKQENFARKRE